MQHTGYFPTIRDSITSSNINEWYDHFITFTHSICQGWDLMERAVSLKDRIKGKENAAMPILDNAANGILKRLMDRVHPESTRNNILTIHKIGSTYNHPEQYFVSVIAYLTNFLTNIQTTEENIDGLNNAFRNIPYLAAPRLSNITERKATHDNDHYYDSPNQQEFVNQDGLCKRAKRCRYNHSREALMQQWFSL